MLIRRQNEAGQAVEEVTKSSADTFLQEEDGCIFSSKYESQVKTFKPPKVVCFANFAPIKDALSADRWWIFKVADDTLQMVI
ncbi:hypothetical protein DPMN_084925 [Dreissena polymorpha]|uniref:Uncharacterized protein n=1 Tax=Dreissena polymorpha TaxID=45954 RepID=A0A9D3YF54_DREPO|nr:hypothetical protein DPMN_084925 [Dreissena polymorpha]